MFCSRSAFTGLPNRGDVNSLPFFSISGFSNNNINLLSPVNDGHAQFADNLSWVHGRHTMKFGVEEINWFVNRYMPNNSGNPIFGSYAFTGKFTGNAYADFLLGLPATVTRAGALCHAIQPVARLGRLCAGRFQSHSTSHADVLACATNTTDRLMR